MIGGNATSLLAVDLLGVPIADEATPIQARRLAQDDRVGAENWVTSCDSEDVREPRSGGSDPSCD
jgi:hypothetical protein